MKKGQIWKKSFFSIQSRFWGKTNLPKEKGKSPFFFFLYRLKKTTRVTVKIDEQKHSFPKKSSRSQ